MRVKTKLSLGLSTDAVTMTVEPGGKQSVIPLDQIRSVEIAGRGARDSDAGIIGGGFGIEGAAGGMLAAAVVNALTAQTTIETFVALETGDWTVVVFSDFATPDVVRREWAPALGPALRSDPGARARNAPDIAGLGSGHATTPAQPEDPSRVASSIVDPSGRQAASPAEGLTDDLERLAALRTAGELTDEEYAAAKKRLIDGTSDRNHRRQGGSAVRAAHNEEKTASSRPRDQSAGASTSSPVITTSAKPSTNSTT